MQKIKSIWEDKKAYNADILMLVMRGKIGQISIFIIVAILILAGVVSFFIFKDKLGFGATAIPKDLAPITNSVQTCIQTTLEDGAKLAGLQGGYIIPPGNALETNFSYIAYGYYLGTNSLASKTKIENEISKYIELTLPFCFDSTSFPDYKITSGNVKATTKINTNSVSTSVNFPITASKAETSWNLNNKYAAEYKIKLGEMYSVAQSIIEKETSNSNNIDFSYLNSFGYDISILNEGNEIIVYSITDYDLNPAGSYTFRFASRLK